MYYTNKDFKNYFDIATEACKDLASARELCQKVMKLAKKYNANFFFVTDGASTTDNKGNRVVEEMRRHMHNWELKNGFNPDDDWRDNPSDTSGYRLANESSHVSNSVLRNIVNFNNYTNLMEYIITPKSGKSIMEIKHNDFVNHYYSLKPEEFKDFNGGVCWDYVPFEAQYFKKHFKNVKYKTFFACHIDDNANPTHTFLLFYLNDKCYWFESSWKSHMGIYEFDNEDEALSYIKDELYNALDFKANVHDYFVVEYDALNKKMFGLSCVEYMEIMSKMKEYRYKQIKNVQVNVISHPVFDKNNKLIL